MIAENHEQHEWGGATVKTLADCNFNGNPECFHYEARLPKTAEAELSGKNVLVYCPKCGCTTPFPVK
jgi:hypothetical protein